MIKILFPAVLFLVACVATAHAVDTPALAPASVPAAVVTAEELSKFIYSYGTILQVSETEIVVQEYDYDSDIEKQVTYQIDPAIQLQGFKAITELAPEDVIEIYYLDQDNKKIAKIIRKEAMEEEGAGSDNSMEGGN